MVEHHLAKVRVAGSNPVVRSGGERVSAGWHGGVAERRGNGLQIRLHGFESRLHLDGSEPPGQDGAISAAVARFPDTEEVTGSNPVSPTTNMQVKSTFHTWEIGLVPTMCPTGTALPMSG